MSDDKSDPKPQRMKKSETLEVRLPHETKQAFLTACREDGTTASEVVRGSIDDYLDARVRPTSQPETGKLLHMIPRPIRKRRYLVGAAAVLVTGLAVALPSAAGPDMKSVFDRLDANHDGMISPDEFSGPADAEENVTVTRRTITHAPDAAGSAPAPDAASPPKPISEEAAAYWLPDADGASGASHGRMIRRSEAIVVAYDKAAPAPPMDEGKREFLTFDADGDGKISFAEFETRQKAMLTAGFKLLDGNSDGFLTPAEYAGIAKPPEMPQTIRAPNGQMVKIPPTAMPPMDPPISTETLNAAFAKLDKNGDKKLSLQEYLP